MTLRLEFTELATAQIHTAAAWWRANRPAAPEQFEDDLSASFDQLVRAPLLAQVFAEIDGRVVRRVRLPRTQHSLYFTVAADTVTVHALWHGARGSGPPLP